MKSILSFALMALITAILITISCQKSINDGPDNPGNKPIEYVTATITGRILDESGQPVSAAAVKAGSAATTTDINGSFRITNVSLDKNAGFIKVEKDGFFQGSRTIIVNAGVVNYISLQLIKKTVAGTVSGSSGGNITVPTGGSINFGGNSFVNTGTNSTYTGTVSVSAFFINPAASNFNEIMPGTLRGINTSNQETGLQSFGMMAVELTGAGGEKLQLASGKTATLTFPIPAALQASAPATIPLWSFNDTTGLWKEEGSATKQGANYVGTVSHFSFWNCDYPYSGVDFKAIIKDQNGNPLYPVQVAMKITSDTVSSYGYGYTDETGLVSGKIPSGKTFELKILNKCGAVLYTQNVGPFNSTADLGTIILTVPAYTQVTVSGSVVNCNGVAVTNGFVDVNIDSFHTRAVVTNGSFSVAFSRCNNTQTTAYVTAYDMSTSQIGSASAITITSGTVNAGTLSACGTTVAEFLNYTLNSTNYSFVPPADSLAMDGSVSNGYTVWATRKTGGGNSRDQVYLWFNASGTGTVSLNYVVINLNTSQYVGQSAVNITEFGTPGNYISGNFSAVLKDTLNSANTAPVTLSFRVKRYQ